MNSLEIHCFNVGRGSVILVRVPKRPCHKNACHNILIDAGNAGPGNQAKQDDLLLKAMCSIHTITEGHVDLYVITTYRTDCMRGPTLLHEKTEELLIADQVWAPVNTETYQRSKSNVIEEEKQTNIDHLRAVMVKQQHHVGTANESEIEQILNATNPSEIHRCLDFIKRQMLPNSRKFRSIDNHTKTLTLNKNLGIADVSVDVWAPVKKMEAERVNPILWAASSEQNEQAPVSTRQKSTPPCGVGMSDYYRLTRDRENNSFGNALMLQRRANNHSLVLQLSWKGRQLLFSGHAEEQQWRAISDGIQTENRSNHALDFWQVSHNDGNCFAPIGLIESLLGHNPEQHNKPICLIATSPNHSQKHEEGASFKKLRALSKCVDISTIPFGKVWLTTLSAVP